MTTALANRFRDIVSDLRDGLKGNPYEYRPYRIGSRADEHEAEYIDMSGTYANVRDFITPMSVLSAVPIFDRDERFVKSMKFYVIVVQPENDEPMYFFRWYAPKNKIRRANAIVAFFTSDVYDVLEEDAALLFDTEIDFFSQGDYIYILQKNNFQRLFPELEIVFTQADDVLNLISTTIVMDNFDLFREHARSHTWKRRKLNVIAQNSYLDRINTASLRRLIGRYPVLAKAVRFDGDNATLIYDPAEPWLVLKILEDSFVDSPLTETSYEVTGGKRPLV